MSSFGGGGMMDSVMGLALKSCDMPAEMQRKW